MFVMKIRFQSVKVSIGNLDQTLFERHHMKKGIVMVLSEQLIITGCCFHIYDIQTTFILVFL